MRFNVFSVILVAAAILPQRAQAAAPAYSYVDTSYVRTDYDGIGSSADGFLLRGSVGITDNVYLIGHFADQSVFGVTLRDYGLGAGDAWSVSPATDLYAELSIVKLVASYQGFSVDDTGFGSAVGIRSRVSDRIELEASINYIEYMETGDDTTFRAAGRWHFTDHLALQAETGFGSGANIYQVGLRWTFGD